MGMDIFSSFDDKNKVIFNFYGMIWVFPMLMVSILTMKMKSMGSIYSSVVFLIVKVSYSMNIRSQSKNIGGASGIIGAVMMMIMYFNLIGLSPYIFSLTSHMVVNLSISLPLWLCIVLMGSSFSFMEFMAHLLPMGAPSSLSPFLSLIELVSNFLRPITLSVRLSANVTAGHILMTMLGLAFMSSSGSVMMLLIVMVATFYFLFEMVICLVQSYIFSFLPSIYMDEHPKFW